MRRELLVPKLGLTMSEGMLVEWMVSPGEAFKAEQGIFVVESDKAATEIAAEADGHLLETCVEIGQTLPVGSVIGYWDDGEPADGKEKRPPSNGTNGHSAGTPAAKSASESIAVAAHAGGTAQRVLATPLARRVRVSHFVFGIGKRTSGVWAPLPAHQPAQAAPPA